MGRPPPELVIREAIAEWPSDLETDLFGTSSAERIWELVRSHAVRHLGRDELGLSFYRRGVGAVFGVELGNRSAVIKVHRPELVADRLPAIVRLQERLAVAGLPAPRPLSPPSPLANGIATIEQMIRTGTAPDAHDRALRRRIAMELHRFVEAASGSIDEFDQILAPPFALPDDRLWPLPHDLRFDFTLAGADWIDEAARGARDVLRGPSGRRVVGHLDWRAENLRVESGRLVAIFDWDSVFRSWEPALIGTTADHFAANWEREDVEPFPTLKESAEFIAAYEQARGHPFTPSERATANAANLYALAYTARCEHSDAARGLADDTGALAADRLRARMAQPLFPTAIE